VLGQFLLQFVYGTRLGQEGKVQAVARPFPQALAAEMESAVPGIDHRKAEVHSLVRKFSQNLHVGDMLVEAEEQRLQPRAKYPRLLVARRPSPRALYVIQRPFVLQ